VLDRGRPRVVVVLVVLGAERLEQEAVGDELERRLEVVRNEGHLDIVSGGRSSSGDDDADIRGHDDPRVHAVA